MDGEFLAPLRGNWEPVSKPVRIGWLAFYGIFLLYAFRDRSGYLLIDYVFVPIHEGGHLLFIHASNPPPSAGATSPYCGLSAWPSSAAGGATLSNPNTVGEISKMEG